MDRLGAEDELDTLNNLESWFIQHASVAETDDMVIKGMEVALTADAQQATQTKDTIESVADVFVKGRGRLLTLYKQMLHGDNVVLLSILNIFRVGTSSY